MSEIKLLGATLLHTRYGHWQHPKSRQYFINPVRDNFRHYPGLAEDLLTIHQRALNHEHTIHDQQRIQWLAQACFGALDIYQLGISTRSVSREDILEDIEAWFADQNDGLAHALFTPILYGDGSMGSNQAR